jgi:formate hydrogenlyase subunit 4
VALEQHSLIADKAPITISGARKYVASAVLVEHQAAGLGVTQITILEGFKDV